MLPRFIQAKEKLEKYTKKLSKSPYYLAARILNPKRRTAFLKDKIDGDQQLYIVRKLWKRFRDKASSLDSVLSYDA